MKRLYIFNEDKRRVGSMIQLIDGTYISSMTVPIAFPAFYLGEDTTGKDAKKILAFDLIPIGLGTPPFPAQVTLE